MLFNRIVYKWFFNTDGSERTKRLFYQLNTGILSKLTNYNVKQGMVKIQKYVFNE